MCWPCSLVSLFSNNVSVKVGACFGPRGHFAVGETASTASRGGFPVNVRVADAPDGDGAVSSSKLLAAAFRHEAPASPPVRLYAWLRFCGSRATRLSRSRWRRL